MPVVHSVGGLRDTVKPFNPFESSGTGEAPGQQTLGGAEQDRLQELLLGRQLSIHCFGLHPPMPPPCRLDL